MKPLSKKKFYVKSGDLEKWVLALDEINAAIIAFDNAPEDILLDTTHFYVSTKYIPEIETSKYFIDFGVLVDVQDVIDTVNDFDDYD